MKIRIISTEYKKHTRDYEYRFEMIDPDVAAGNLFLPDEVDFLDGGINKCLLVRLNSDQDHPHLEEVIEVLNPDEYRY